MFRRIDDFGEWFGRGWNSDAGMKPVVIEEALDSGFNTILMW